MTKAIDTTAKTTAKTTAISAINNTMAEIAERAKLYPNKIHRECVSRMGIFAALTNAAKAAQNEFLEWLEKESNIVEIKDCSAFISALKAISFYNKNWPTPQSVYNGAQARKNQGRNSAWQFLEDAPNGGIVRNMDDNSEMKLPEFLSVLRICKMFDKRRDVQNVNERLKELHKSVMQKITLIETAKRRGNNEECRAVQAALKAIFTDAQKAKVTFTASEIASYNEAISNGIARQDNMPKSVSAEIATAQKEAAEKAQKEAAEKIAAERAEKLAARREAEKAQKEAAAQKALWDAEREKIRTENATKLAAQNEAANRWKKILPLLQAIPKNLDGASPEEMRDFLERLAKQV